MHVFLTGLTGFLGGYVVPELVRRGHRVRALVRRLERGRERVAAMAADGLAAEMVELVAGDLASEEALAAALEGCDAVMHLAGLIAARSLEEFRAVNVRGTANVLGAALRQPALPRFVLVSSIAAAGPSRPGRPGTEEDPPKPVSWYGVSKREGEEHAARCADRLHLAIARPPAVYGPGDLATLAFFRMARSGWAPFPGDPRLELSLIHVADLARGLALVLESGAPSGRTYYLTGEGAPTFADVIAAIASSLGHRARVVRVPRWLGFAAALGSEAWSRCRGVAPQLSRDKLRELRAPAWTCSGERARHELGFHPEIGWREGLERTALWYREHRWL